MGEAAAIGREGYAQALAELSSARAGWAATGAVERADLLDEVRGALMPAGDSAGS